MTNASGLQPLTSDADVGVLLAAPQAWLLKHSNTCPTSAAALDEVEAWLATHPGTLAGIVVVQTHRPVSNLIATRLNRVHQSPQLFLLRGGSVAWAVSHWQITAAAMDAAWAKP
jgi:bacillithiol system protein YtxJ